MALSRDQIVFMSLVALDEALEQQRRGEYDPPFALRAVLAMLHAIAGGPAQPFADFWRGCCQPISWLSSGYTTEVERSQLSSGAWHQICRALGVQQTIRFTEDIHVARRAQLPQAAHRSAIERELQEQFEAERNAFAKRLYTNSVEAMRNDVKNSAVEPEHPSSRHPKA